MDRVQIRKPKGGYIVIDRDAGKVLGHYDEEIPGIRHFVKRPFVQKEILEDIDLVDPESISPTPPPVQIRKFSYEENCYCFENKTWNLPTLLKAIGDQGCILFDFPLSSIDLSRGPWGSIDNVEIFLYHAKRAIQCDLSYPLIFDWDGYLADGWHRVAKAILEGVASLKAYRLKEYVQPDFTREVKSDNE